MPDPIAPLYLGYLITGVIIFIAGAFLNLWFLVAIFRSQKVRSRLRNKIICNTFLINLLNCLLVQPLSKITWWHYIYGHPYTCGHISAIIHLEHVQDFLENWILVMLLAIFIAQIQNVHTSRTCSQRTITVATSVLLVLPWIVSLTIVPVALYAIGIRSNDKDGCFSDTTVFTSIDTAIPLCLSLFLVIIAALLRHLRFGGGYSRDGMSIELVSSGAETEPEPGIDSACAYATAVVVSIVCDSAYMLSLVIENNINFDFIEWYRLLMISETMSQLRVVVLPLVWLLFPDIRQQIRTWRPWRRPPPDADMRVTYRRESD